MSLSKKKGKKKKSFKRKELTEVYKSSNTSFTLTVFFFLTLLIKGNFNLNIYIIKTVT